MKTILIPVDFSNTSLNALQYAFFLAQNMSFNLECLHAYKKKNALNGNSTSESAILERLEKHIKKAKPETFQNKVIPHAFNGELVKGVASVSNKTKPELLVMGTKGVRGLKKILVGSNTTEVMASTDLTLLIVPESFRLNDIKFIMWASDLKPVNNKGALQLLISLAKRFDSEIRIVHVKTSDKKGSCEKHWEMQQESQLLDDIKHSFKKIRRSTVSKGITYYLNLKKDNDLLVLVRREYNFLDSLFRKDRTHGFACNPEIPIMVIHE